jgi:hypothetical protein
MSNKNKVLALYRMILKVSKNWEALEAKNTQKERDYIFTEAHKCFHENKSVLNCLVAV